MAKALGSFLCADARTAVLTGECEAVRRGSELLLTDPTIARNDDGSWGYEFDVQTRWAYYPAGSPNIIATTFVARGLLEASLVCGDDRARDAHIAAAGFIANELVTADGWLRYTLDSAALIHNANLLGAGLLAAAGTLSDRPCHTTAALRAARVSVRSQRSDGSWAYGIGDRLAWCDNFHTAYNLDGLLHVWLATGDADIRAALDAGCSFWVDRFFADSGAPAYFAGGGPPYDVHSAGTAIDVAARLSSHGFDTLELAQRVERWTKAHLMAADGTTYYRVTPRGTDRRHFVRWGDAHVAMGSASLRLAEASVVSPVESALIGRKGA